MANVDAEVPGKGAGYNELKGYEKISEGTMRTFLTDNNGFTPSIPSIDPDNERRVKYRPKPRTDACNETGFRVTPTQYQEEFNRSHQKGWKGTKVGVHAHPLEHSAAELLSKKTPKPDTFKDAPTLNEMNEEYNRYQYGYQSYPGNYGQNLEGSRNVITMGNQVITQPSIALGGDVGGRRYGRNAEKYSVVDRY